MTNRRWKLIAGIAAAAALALGPAMSASATTYTIYQYQLRGTNLCLNAPGKNANLTLASCSKSAINQQWYYTSHGGYPLLASVGWSDDGTADWSVTTSSLSVGARASLQIAANTSRQSWDLNGENGPIFNTSNSALELRASTKTTSASITIVNRANADGQANWDANIIGTKNLAIRG